MNAPHQRSGVEAEAEAFTALEAWQALAEYDDRTSPEEYPDMALITFEELRIFMSRANFNGCTCGEVCGEDPACPVCTTDPTTAAKTLRDANLITPEQYNRICANIRAKAGFRGVGS